MKKQSPVAGADSGDNHPDPSRFGCGCTTWRDNTPGFGGMGIGGRTAWFVLQPQRACLRELRDNNRIMR